MRQISIGLFALISITVNAQEAQKTEAVQLKIMHYQAPCYGESVRLCYLVSKEGREPEFFYHSIEGFEYEWGYDYGVLVEEYKVEKPKADGSSLGYRLKKLISKIKVPADLSFELPLVLNGYRLVETDGNICSYFGKVGINTGAFSCDSLSIAQTGIFQHDDAGLRLVGTK